MSFTGDTSVGYRANLWLRSAIRVLRLLHETLLDGERPSGEEVRRRQGRQGQRVHVVVPRVCRQSSTGGLACSQMHLAASMLILPIQAAPFLAGAPAPVTHLPSLLQIYDAFRESADWARLLEPNQSFSVEGRVWSCSNLSSSQVPAHPSAIAALAATAGACCHSCCRCCATAAVNQARASGKAV